SRDQMNIQSNSVGLIWLGYRGPLRPFDENSAFRPPADGSEALRRRAVRGAAVTVFTGGVGHVIQIISTMVLARLLTPSDFGLVAMVNTFSLLLSNFGVNGFTEAVLQLEEVDRLLASNLFWINLGGGLLLASGFASAGPLIARFYDNPEVSAVAVGMALPICIFSLSVLHTALLQRAMRFSAVSGN